MATVQIDGTTAVTSTSTKNNSGIIKKGGNVANTAIWSTTDLGLQGSLSSHFNYVASGANVGNTGIIAAAGFNINIAEGMVRRVTSTITDIANTVLVGGDSYKAAITGSPVEGDATINYASGIRNGDWGIYSGVFSPALIVTADSFGADEAARVNRTKAATYRFLVGAPTPSGGHYALRTT